MCPSLRWLSLGFALLLLPACDLLHKKGDTAGASSSKPSDDDAPSTAKPSKKAKGDDGPSASSAASATAAASASAAPSPAGNSRSTCVKACDDLIAKMTSCLPDGATQADEWRKNLGRMKAIDAEGLGDMCVNRLQGVPALKTCDATEPAPPSACARLRFLCRQTMKYDAMVKALGADPGAPHYNQWTDCEDPAHGDEPTCQKELDGMKKVISALKPYDQHRVLEGCP